MAFCNSCGAALTPGTRFCSKCGATVTVSSPAAATPAVTATPAAPAGQAPRQSSSALKIILIIVAVIVVLGILAVGTFGFFVWRVAKHAHVRQEGNNVKVETPFGSAETTQNPEEAARDLGVEIYPGAQVERQGATTATFMGIHTATARFDSSDSLDKVSSFYKSKFPNAMVSTCDEQRCNIITSDQWNTITINMEADGSGTKIQISNMSRKPN